MASVQVDGSPVKSGKPPPTLYMKNPNIGRRTGVDVLAGKNIRKDEDGNEIFADYFSEREEEDSVFEKTAQPLHSQQLDQDAIKSKKPQSSMCWKKPNVGRRTGVEVTAGKNIRRDEHGNEIFADYFSEMEDESFFDKSLAPKQFVPAQTTNPGEEKQVLVQSAPTCSSLIETPILENVVEEEVQVHLPHQVAETVCIPEDILFDAGGEMGFIGVEDVVIEVESTEPNDDLVADPVETDEDDLIIDNRDDVRINESVGKLSEQDQSCLLSNGDNQDVIPVESTQNAANQSSSSSSSVQLTHSDTHGKPYNVPSCKPETVELAVIQTLQGNDISQGKEYSGASAVKDVNCSARHERLVLVTVPDVSDCVSSTRNSTSEHSSELQRNVLTEKNQASEIKTVEKVKCSVTGVPFKINRSKSPILQNHASEINREKIRNMPVISSSLVSSENTDFVGDPVNNNNNNNTVDRTATKITEPCPMSPVRDKEESTVTTTANAKPTRPRNTQKKQAKTEASKNVSKTRRTTAHSGSDVVDNQQVSVNSELGDGPVQNFSKRNGDVSNSVSKTISSGGKPVTALAGKIRPSQKRYSEELDILPVVAKKDISHGDKNDKPRSSDEEETSDEEGIVLMHYSSTNQEEEEHDDVASNHVRSPPHTAGSALSGAEFTRLMNKKSINAADLEKVFNTSGRRKSRAGPKRLVTSRNQSNIKLTSASEKKTPAHLRSPKNRKSTHKENMPLKIAESEKISGLVSSSRTSKISPRLKKGTEVQSPTKKKRLEKVQPNVAEKPVRRSLKEQRDVAFLPKTNRTTPRANTKPLTKSKQTSPSKPESKVTRSNDYNKMIQRLAAAESMNNFIINELDSTSDLVTPKRSITKQKETLPSRKRRVKGKVPATNLSIKRRKTTTEDMGTNSSFVQKVAKRGRPKILLLSREKPKPLAKLATNKKLVPKRHATNLSKTLIKHQTVKSSKVAAASKTKTKIKPAIKKTKAGSQLHSQRTLRGKHASSVKPKKLSLKKGLGFQKKLNKVVKQPKHSRLKTSGTKKLPPVKKGTKSVISKSTQKVKKSPARTRTSEKPTKVIKSPSSLTLVNEEQSHAQKQNITKSSRGVLSKSPSLSTQPKLGRPPVSKRKPPVVVKKEMKAKEVIVTPNLKRPSNLRRNSSLVDLGTPVPSLSEKTLNNTAESIKVINSSPSRKVEKNLKRKLNRTSTTLVKKNSTPLEKTFKRIKTNVPNETTTSRKSVLKEPLRTSKSSERPKSQISPKKIASKNTSLSPPSSLRSQNRKKIDLPMSPSDKNDKSGVTKLKAKYLYLSQIKQGSSRRSSGKSVLPEANRKSDPSVNNISSETSLLQSTKASKNVPLATAKSSKTVVNQPQQTRKNKKQQKKLESLPAHINLASESDLQTSVSSDIMNNAEFEFEPEPESEPESLQKVADHPVQEPLNQKDLKKDYVRKQARSSRNIPKHTETDKVRSRGKKEQNVKTSMQKTKKAIRSGNDRLSIDDETTSDLEVDVPTPVDFNRSTSPVQGAQIQGKVSHEKKEEKVKNRTQRTKRATVNENDQSSQASEASDLEVDVSSPAGVKRSTSPVQGEQLQEIVLSHRNLLWLGPEENPAQDTDPFIVAKCFSLEKYSSGFMKIRPNQTKPLQVLSSQSLVFVIKFGRLKVQVHHNVWIMEPEDTFMVPVGNAYRIENIRHDEATLVYFSTEHTEF